MFNRHQELNEILGLIITFFVFTLGIPMFALFVGGGFEIQEFFTKAQFYFTVGTASLIGLIGLSLLQLTNGFERGFWRGIIFSPEISILDKTNFGKYLHNPKWMLNFFVIFFGVLGVFSVVTNTFFIGIPRYEQQVTETADLLLAVEPAASSETLFFVVLMSLMLTFLVWWGRKQHMPDNSIKLLSLFVIPFLIMLLGIAFHTLRYSGVETAVLGVAIFWFAGSFLTMLSGNILGFWIFHLMNNLAVRANELFSNEVAIFVIALFVAFYFGIVLLLRFFSNKIRARTLVES